MSDFLKINQLIEIEIEQGNDYVGTYRTRIEDLNKQGIVIGMPMEQGNLVPIRPETQVIIWHWDNQATHAYYCKVKARIFEPLPLVFLDWPFLHKKIQRRNFVRVPAKIKIEYALAKDNDEEILYHNAMIRDLSGGGVQFLSKLNLTKGALLNIRLFLPEQIIECKSLVKWVKEEILDQEIRYLVGLEFQDIPEKLREKIIKYVFARQRELINKGVL